METETGMNLVNVGAIFPFGVKINHTNLQINASVQKGDLMTPMELKNLNDFETQSLSA